MPRASVLHWTLDTCAGFTVEKEGDLWGYVCYTNAKGGSADPTEVPHRRTFLPIPELSVIYEAAVQFTDNESFQIDIMVETANIFVQKSKKYGKKTAQQFAWEINKTVLGHYGPLLPPLKEYHWCKTWEDEDLDLDYSVFKEIADWDAQYEGIKHWCPNEILSYAAIEKSEDTLGLALYVDKDGEDTWPYFGTHYRIFKEIPNLITFYNAVVQITDDENLQYSIIESVIFALFVYDKDFYKNYFETFALEVNEHLARNRGLPLKELDEYELNVITSYKQPGPDDFTEWEEDDEDDWSTDDEDEEEKEEMKRRVPKRTYSISQTRDD